MRAAYRTADSNPAQNMCGTLKLKGKFIDVCLLKNYQRCRTTNDSQRHKTHKNSICGNLMVFVGRKFRHTANQSKTHKHTPESANGQIIENVYSVFAKRTAHKRARNIDAQIDITPLRTNNFVYIYGIDSLCLKGYKVFEFHLNEHSKS